MQKGFQIVDHIADVRVRAWGSNFETVFSEISNGMWSVMLGADEIPVLRNWLIEISGIDMDDLLVNFLNEQLALFDIDGLVVSQIKHIEFGHDCSADDICVKATLCGCHISDFDGCINVEIKAATFHELHLTSTEAWVTFDV